MCRTTSAINRRASNSAPATASGGGQWILPERRSSGSTRTTRPRPAARDGLPADRHRDRSWVGGGGSTGPRPATRRAVRITCAHSTCPVPSSPHTERSRNAVGPGQVWPGLRPRADVGGKGKRMPRWFQRLSGVVAAVGLVLAGMAATVGAAPASYAAGFDQDPSGDAYLDQHLAVDAGMANGLILSSRSVKILPPLAATSSFAAWQIWFKSTDAGGQPIAALTTLLKPVAWNGRTVSNNYAIDGVGLRCNPSYVLTHQVSIEAPDITRQLLGRGYAVVMTDYQGPHMAYAHGPTQGPEVLDGIRAALALPAAGLAGSPVAMIGYSGGAIATAWAAQLQPTYAPELHLVGAASGGTPADLSLLPPRMDGKPPAAVLFLLAVLGVARVTPGALELLNPVGVQTAQQFKNSCFSAAVLGVTPLPLRALTTVPPYETDIVRGVFAATKVGGGQPTVPIYLWHGVVDLWIPLAGAQALYQTWTSAGVDVSLNVVPGDHITSAFDPGALDRIDRWMGR
ncbi:hypothetical protein EEB14_53180 [Rhodococcus sp. WS4]|nr:hypothetical protein EEB14_53180 [Rhodococcus sp. WS4]